MDSHVYLDYLTSWEPLNKLGIGQITFQLVEYTSNWYFGEKFSSHNYCYEIEQKKPSINDLL